MKMNNGQGVLGFLGLVMLVLVMIALPFGLDYVGRAWNIKMLQIFGVKQANVEREIYEGTHSYNSGMAQELEDMERNYVMAQTQEQKAAIAALFLNRLAEYPHEQRLPQDLQNFANKLRNQQGLATN